MPQIDRQKTIQRKCSSCEADLIEKACKFPELLPHPYELLREVHAKDILERSNRYARSRWTLEHLGGSFAEYSLMIEELQMMMVMVWRIHGSQTSWTSKHAFPYDLRYGV